MAQVEARVREGILAGRKEQTEKGMEAWLITFCDILASEPAL
jgi:hypothetical protein